MILSYQGPEKQFKRWLIGLASIAALGAALVSLPLGDGLARLSFDIPFRFRGAIENTNVVVLLEDRAALEDLGQAGWPPSRVVHALLLNILRTNGARLVLFDIGFVESKPAEDSKFASAIRDKGDVILGCSYVPSSHQHPSQPGAIINELKPPAEQLRTNAAGWGLAKALSFDDVFGARKMVTACGADDVAIWVAVQRTAPLGSTETAEDERWINFYGPPPALSRITFSELLQTNSSTFGQLRGKDVFVGVDQSEKQRTLQSDVFETPYSRSAPGTEVLANAYANLLHRDWLRRVSTPMQAGLAAIMGAVAVVLLVFFGRRYVLLTSFGLFAILALVVLVTQWHTRYWWNWLVPELIQLPLATLLALVCPRLPVKAFISYRRTGGGAFALALLQALRNRAQDARLDVNDMASGEFPPQLLHMIERAPNFILVLSPNALDERVHREDDFIRREILHALANKKKIIPILIDGFSFPSATKLPVELERLRDCQSIQHYHDKWEATIDQLERYLR